MFVLNTLMMCGLICDIIS